MTCGILEEKEKLELESLRARYDEAFAAWAFEVGRRRAIAGSAPSSVVMETEARVAAAELAYRESRDRLLEGILCTRAESNGYKENKSLRAAL
jgi:hypothetical protein